MFTLIYVAFLLSCPARVQIVTWSALHIEAGIIVLFVIDLFSSGCLSSLAEKKMDKMQSVEY